MKNKPFGKIIYLFAFLLILQFSCSKDLQKEIQIKSNEEESGAVSSKALMTLAETSCVEDQQDGSTGDSILQPTILGARLNGSPYSVTTMRQAYTNL